MSFLTRPSVAFAIVFGCFAVLVPRIFLPLLRSQSSVPSHNMNDHFRRPSSSPMRLSDDDHTTEHNSDSSSHMHSAHPNMRMRQADADNRQPSTIDKSNSKSGVTFALPMYTVGIGVFFLYTCFKYWPKRNTDETKIKLRYSTDNIQWNAQQKKFKYNMNTRYQPDDEEIEEDLYAGLDPDYVEYLRLKKQKEIDAEQTLTTEQRQMHNTLDEMKNSLSFISSKLGASQTRNKLTNNEISQLQDRLATTEAQMCKIVNALDAASNEMSKLTKNTRQTLEQPQQIFIGKEESHHLSSRSQSESENSINNEENSNSDENSIQEDEQLNKPEEKDEYSSSSYEDEEEEIRHEEDNDSESDSASERYGIMTTNYECDPTTIDDYELNIIKKPEQTTDSRTKVQEWHERNHSQSLSSNSSTEQDQTIPNEE
ncbi:unnamed protein product [Adineta steineri]|uniref:Resistance to inhibitors of cholinesterase protein 3 N-terminal domain-containing protein n=3 Tax=Adineta steineri TaxID=433720 RepID=A0A815HTB2_9BILA|nr:unnamed protein product [Adineta steineri]